MSARAPTRAPSRMRRSSPAGGSLAARGSARRCAMARRPRPGPGPATTRRASAPPGRAAADAEEGPDTRLSASSRRRGGRAGPSGWQADRMRLVPGIARRLQAGGLWAADATWRPGKPLPAVSIFRASQLHGKSRAGQTLRRLTAVPSGCHRATLRPCASVRQARCRRRDQTP